ncbi:Uncharacterized membrane protein YccC [Kaistia soli DSM 19436]|uniref:Uncharacterized membrane protein YccC n=1 Tax=Kaistia soli DSM 19436 TaxID=1122133 RepID=A0A1M5L5H8_9HYPH|nr:FUSC family protein [Kaistia soli]SHG60210.1 Uncharacterized membrane protein YccC [Kaistia soli DSM 19436]
MTAAVGQRPLVLAGFPIAGWAFALRTWIALVLALYAAFRLELQSPATAALTVAVLAFPTRGQGMEKAAYRVAASIIGLTAAVGIIGIFHQTGGLLIAVLALWIGACVFVSCLLDGFRSYAAVLCIISVALVAIEPLDMPQSVFQLAHERGAAIVVGIIASTLVNDILFAPDHHPRIHQRLADLQHRVAAFGRAALQGISPGAGESAALLRDITGLRPDITGLALESSLGPRRSTAARTAMVDLVFTLAAARMLAVLTAGQGATRDPRAPAAGAIAWMTAELRRRQGDVAASLAALTASKLPQRGWRSPLYRSTRIAAANALRAIVYFSLSAAALALAGWDATSVSLAFVGILIGLSFMAPDPAGASKLALVAAPIGGLLAGILEFVVLDGVSDFPLLAIGLLPFVLVPTLLMTLPNLALASLGRSNLVFAIAIFSPANQQSYSPQTFLFSCLFLCLASLLLAICQKLLPPLEPARQRRILLGEAARDLDNRQASHRPHREEQMFRDAGRVSRIAATTGKDTAGQSDVEAALRMFDEAAILRLAGGALDMLPADTPHDQRRASAAAVAAANAGGMIAAADLLASRMPSTGAAALAAAGLALARLREPDTR